MTPEGAPIEPPESPWQFPTAARIGAIALEGGVDGLSDSEAADADERHDASDLVAVGADLEPGTLLAAYRVGLFPMPEGSGGVGWWSPAHRGVLDPRRMRVSRSLRRSARTMQIRVDTAFEDVVVACGDPRRPHGWIDDEIIEAYTRLHRLGWAHSVEAWREDRLVGGVYGVELGGLFAGESMFHRETDASKVALLGLVEGLLGDEHGAEGRRLIDVQWSTPHLASLGVHTIARADYTARLASLLAVPPSPMWRSEAFRPGR